MTIGEAFVGALALDLVILALVGAWQLYGRSQRRLARASDDRGRLLGVSAVTGPVLHPVTGQAPMVIEGQVVSLDQAPVPVWMDRTYQYGWVDPSGDVQEGPEVGLR